MLPWGSKVIRTRTSRVHCFKRFVGCFGSTRHTLCHSTPVQMALSEVHSHSHIPHPLLFRNVCNGLSTFHISPVHIRPVCTFPQGFPLTFIRLVEKLWAQEISFFLYWRKGNVCQFPNKSFRRKCGQQSAKICWLDSWGPQQNDRGWTMTQGSYRPPGFAIVPCTWKAMDVTLCCTQGPGWLSIQFIISLLSPNIQVMWYTT